MGEQMLTDKEFDVLVLCIVEGCLAYSKESGKPFEEVLVDELFINANTPETVSMIDKVYYEIEKLHNKGYISGTVELAYESDLDDTSEGIWYSECVFENIKITTKGKMQIALDAGTFVVKDFTAKAKPYLEIIGKHLFDFVIECLKQVIPQLIFA